MQIFISYSSLDSKIVKEYRDEFLSKNIDVWMAPYSIPYGESYISSIPQGLISSDLTVVFISSNSLKSEWVQRELEHSSSQRKRIVPIFIENVQLTPAFKFLLSESQYIRFSDKTQNPKENLKGLINQIHGYDQKSISPIDEYNSVFLKNFSNLNHVFSTVKYTFLKQQSQIDEQIDLDALVSLHSKTENDLKADKLIKTNNKYFVTGGAGSGKSTLIKKTLYDVCADTISNKCKVIPIYISLPRLIHSQKMNKELIFDVFNNLLSTKIKFDDFKEMTKDYKFVIAFDALDEYSLEDNQIKINLLNDINKLFNEINCSIVVGSRNIDYLNDKTYSIVKLNPMSKEQSIDFIQKYLSYFESSISALDFYNKLPSSLTSGFVTPLLLSIIIATYVQTHKVPDTIDGLYNQYIRKLLSSVNDDTDFINNNFLAACKLAFEMLIKGTTSIKRTIINKTIDDKIISNLIYSGLLSLDSDDLMFIHSTFMEYLAQLEASKEYGFIPKETMDQHFLKDINIINKIISIANITKDDNLMELGAGIGSVAAHYPDCKTLTLVDLDPNLCKILRYNFKNQKNTVVLEQDAIKALKEVKFNKLITDLPFFLTKDVLNTLKTIPFDIAVMSVKSDEQLNEFDDSFNIVEITKVDGSCFYPTQPFSSKIVCVTKKSK